MRQTTYALVFSVLILSSFVVNAQPTFEISLADKSLGLNNLGYRIEKVFDDREDKSHLGIVHFPNGKEFAVFNGDLDATYGAFLERSVIAQKSAMPIVVKVDRIYIHEHLKHQKKLARADIRLKFYALGEDGIWAKIFESAQFEESDVWDSQKAHVYNIMSATQKALIDLANFLNADNQVSRVDKNNLIQIPIYRDDEYESGIFKSLEAFQQHRPSSDLEYKSRINGDKIKLWLIKDGKKEKGHKSDIFGFAHKNKLYIRFLEAFYELKKLKKALCLMALLSTIRKHRVRGISILA